MTGVSDMTVFVRVVEDGGFSAAARGLGLTPSAVSKVIGRLEDRLNTRLLQRSTRRFSLTHEGVIYYHRASAILKDIEEAEAAVSQFNAAPRGTLTVATSAAFAASQIAPITAAFLDTYPEIRLCLQVSDGIADLIEDGVDVAIRMGARTDSSLISRLIVEDYRVICAAPAYLARHGVPRTPDDLAAHNCLTWNREHAELNNWPFKRPDGDRVITVAGNTQVNNGEALTELTLAGVGIARLAEFRVGHDIQAGRLVPLLTESHRLDPLPLHAVYPHRRHLSPKVRAFVDFLIRRFSPVPPWRVGTDGDG